MTEAAGVVITKEKPEVPRLRVGIWWFLASEIAVFGGAVACYLLYKMRYPEWAKEAHHLLIQAGIINTVILLTSSLTMVLAHERAEKKEAKKAGRYLGFSFLLGLCFLLIKAYEYSSKWSQGYTISKSLFWSFYYLLTGLHALHVLAGIVAIFILFLYVLKNRALERVEGVALYWHFVDIVWIFLFPLLYIITGKSG